MAKKKKRIAKKISAGSKKAAPKAKKMSSKESKKYKELLIKYRSKADGELSHIAENTLKKSQRDSTGDLSGYAYHMADMASDDYERDFSLGRATEEQKVLYRIDEALKRIEEGTYGICLQCGKAIAKNRLNALPYTELCIDCQKTNEAK